MYPEVFHIGPLAFAPYGICVAFGIMLSVFLSKGFNRKEGFLESYLYDRTMLLGIIFALIGARFLYVVTTPEEFSGNWGRVFQFSDGGLVFYGGPIASTLYLLWHFVYSKSAKGEFDRAERWKRFGRFADIAIPATVIGHAFGRIGCLLGGCCYGRPFAHESFLSVRYPEGSDAHFADLLQNGAELHGNVPVPLFEAIALVFLFLWLMRLRTKRSFYGEVFLSYLVLYPALRFLLELFRGDAVRGYILELQGVSKGLSEFLGLSHNSESPLFLSTSQGISLLVMALAFYASRQITKGNQTSTEGLEGL